LGDPFLLMIAGPNGAGKTTLFRNLRQSGVDFGEYINPDDIALELQGSYDERVRQAQTIADQRRDACIAAGRSFSFETVMSHPSKIDILARAKATGFFVQLFFVGIDDPRTNIDRVRLRVAQGGHDVPLDKIIPRWMRTMALLGGAIKLADQSFVRQQRRGRRSGPQAGADGGAQDRWQCRDKFEGQVAAVLGPAIRPGPTDDRALNAGPA
jgi:predicted ABC-type ATPase